MTKLTYTRPGLLDKSDGYADSYNARFLRLGKGGNGYRMRRDGHYLFIACS